MTTMICKASSVPFFTAGKTYEVDYSSTTEGLMTDNDGNQLLYWRDHAEFVSSAKAQVQAWQAEWQNCPTSHWGDAIGWHTAEEIARRLDELITKET